jgi:hypothetical protein
MAQVVGVPQDALSKAAIEHQRCIYIDSDNEP